MSKNFLDILDIARENIKNNPNIVNKDTIEAARDYLNGVIDETREVGSEVKENNTVYLIDELGDIAWDYACLLALLEERGLISKVEDVIDHSYDKYTERKPAFMEGSEVKWKEIKDGQKAKLAKKHQDKYGD